MNKQILLYYISKLCKDLDLNGEETFKVLKNLLEKEIKDLKITLSKFLDFFHTMDNDGEFIDPETISKGLLSNKPETVLIDSPTISRYLDSLEYL